MNGNWKLGSFILLFLVLPILLYTGGCGISPQIQQVYNLTKCDFQIRSVEKLNLAGVTIQNIKSISDLNMVDYGRLMAAILGPSFPLSLQLNLQGRNPNTQSAGLNKIDWILYIDEIQMTSGSLDQAFTIPPNQGTAIIPIQISVDLKKVLSGKSAEALINFGMNLTGNGGKPTRFMIKVKPTIMIGSKPLTYPGYITVRTEYCSK